MIEASPPGGELVVLAEKRGERAARPPAQGGARLRDALEDEIVLSRLLGRIDEPALAALFGEFETTSRALTELLALEPAARDGWIEARAWGTEALILAGRLLEEADEVPLGDRLELARLAARVVVRCPIAAGDALTRARVEDVLGRAGLLEVRALRRRGRLEEARGRYGELVELLAEDPSVFYFWLTLLAEEALTRGLLARDAGELTLARSAFHRAGKIFRIAGSEDDDAELLAAHARLDLLKGQPERAVERLTPLPAFERRDRRVALGFLRTHAALRSGAPLLARQAVLGLLVELGSLRPRPEVAPFQVTEAAVRLLEGHPVAALQAVTVPAERLRAEGSLLGSLRGGLVEARALFALRRKKAARKALAASVLESFTDLPDVPSVRSVLAAVADFAAGADNPAFLDRLDLWLVLAEDSPGLGLPA